MVLTERSLYLYVAITVGVCCSAYMRNTKEWAAARGGWGAAGAGAACEDSLGRLALVEHFFSLVFAEFQRAPPVCVCVQMCEQQATYCYPNGCLRRDPPPPPPPRAPALTPAPTPVPTPAPTAAPSADNINSVVEPVETEKLLPIGLRPEHYEDLFKSAYKTPTKIGFKYSARERPRHKSIISMLKDQEDELSVVKSRWPMKKYYGSETNDLSRGEAFGRNYFFSSFYDDKETVMLNQNMKRATNNTQQRVVIGDGARGQLDAGLVVRVDLPQHTTDAAEQYTWLYHLDHHLPHPATLPTTHPATLPSTHSLTHSATNPATHFATHRANHPATLPATHPATLPATHPVTQATHVTHTTHATTHPANTPATTLFDSLETTLSTGNDSDDFHAFYT